MTEQRCVPTVREDRGFGIIEVVISVFLLGVLVIAFLPLLQSSLKLSSNNVTSATAVQLVNEQMDIARGLPATCAAIQRFATETIGLLNEDPRGTVLEVHRTAPSTCPTTYPTNVALGISVTVEGSSEVLAEATTRVFLASRVGTVSP